jgi:hypothetical protein
MILRVEDRGGVLRVRPQQGERRVRVLCLDHLSCCLVQALPRATKPEKISSVRRRPRAPHHECPGPRSTAMSDPTTYAPSRSASNAAVWLHCCCKRRHHRFGPPSGTWRRTTSRRARPNLVTLRTPALAAGRTPPTPTANSSEPAWLSHEPPRTCRPRSPNTSVGRRGCQRIKTELQRSRIASAMAKRTRPGQTAKANRRRRRRELANR